MTERGLLLDDTVPIAVLGPLRAMNAALLELARTFSHADWQAPTIHPERTVKDLFAHLLHGSLRRVTALRDHYDAPTPRITSREELTALIQADNRAFMDGMKRVSPQLLLELTAHYDPELVTLLEALAPHADGLGVVWAGQWTSKNWFDVAREYTEKWHHQQQLRDATGRPPLYEPALLEPVLETLARGLPWAYRALDAPEGTSVLLRVTGEATLSWVLGREGSRWALRRGAEDTPHEAAATLPADALWRVWTKGLSLAAARERSQLTGDPALTAPLFTLVAVMA